MQRPPPPPPRGAGAPPPPPPPFRGAAAAISKAPVSAAVTASTVASSLLDPRGVASLPLRLPEEIAAPPAAAAPPPALAPAKAPHAVLYPFPAPRGDGSQSRVLARVLAAHTAASSSAAHMAAHEAAMAGLGRRARAARTLKRRADDARVQQLRGIFAGHDSDRDGIVGDKDLIAALLGLGVEPTPSVVARFAAAARAATFAEAAGEAGAAATAAGGVSLEDAHAALSPAMEISLQAFVHVITQELPEAADLQSTLRHSEDLFAHFDPAGTGRVPLSALLHVLCEVDGPTSLAADEASDLLRMTGITAELRAREATGAGAGEAATAAALYATEVDYRQLLRHILFPLPRRLPAAAPGAASPKSTAAAAAAASVYSLTALREREGDE